jgi:superfamily I DNA/RNA helicase
MDTSEIKSKTLLRVCNSIKIDEEDGLAYLELFFAEICKILAINIQEYPLLLEHHNSFFESSQKRIKRLINEGNPFIGKLSNFRKVFKQRKGIKVSTIHGVKGEEYDTMIGFALLDDYVPHFSDENGNENSRKMIYVLASRARKNLHIISEVGRGVNYYNPEGKAPTPHLVNLKYDYDTI